MSEKSLEGCAEKGHSSVSRIISRDGNYTYLHCGDCRLVYKEETSEDLDKLMNVFAGAKESYF
jgi:hypothetical protein